MVVSPPSSVPAVPCSRCGAFTGPAELREVQGQQYCQACAERPEVNYLRTFRDTLWGKRDGWAWFYGAFGITSLIGTAMWFSSGENEFQLMALANLFWVASMFCFWVGWAPARWLLPAVTLIIASLGDAVAGGLLSTVLAVAPLFSVRNRLFFRIEPTEAQLQALWSAMYDNRPARLSRGLAVIALGSLVLSAASSMFALFSAFCGATASVLGALGLARVNPQANPPVGRKHQALFGAITGALVSVASLLFLARYTHLLEILGLRSH